MTLANGRVAGRSRSESAYTAMPTGMFTMKTACHPKTLVRMPPRSTPTLPPPAEMKPTTPMAFARSAGSVKSDIMSDRPAAETTAPPRPCAARAATRMGCDDEIPAANDAAVKMPMPATKSFRRPYRSPRRPPRRRNPPKKSMYAFTTQASEASVKPRSVRIDGSATFTMVVSSTIMKLPRQRTTKASQRARTSVFTSSLQMGFVR